jgi:hypothetical protein
MVWPGSKLKASPYFYGWNQAGMAADIVGCGGHRFKLVGDLSGHSLGGNLIALRGKTCPRSGVHLRVNMSCSYMNRPALLRLHYGGIGEEGQRLRTVSTRRIQCCPV